MARILLVDDDITIQYTVAEALRDEGHEVMTASNGREALDHVGSFLPDVLVIDLMMPVMDGWALIAACRADPAYRTVPILVLSASRRAPDDARRLGAQSYLPKPFDLDDLLNEVQRLAATHRDLCRGN